MSNFRPVLRSVAKRLRDVLRFHEAEQQFDAREALGHLLDLVAIGARDTRLVDRADRQDDVLVVQNVIVLQIVQQRGGRGFRIAGQEDRGARHLGGRMVALALDRADERRQRDIGMAGLLHQERRAAAPGPHDDR